MNEFLNEFNISGPGGFVDGAAEPLSFFNCFGGIDINKLLVIILLITGKLRIEAITVYPNDFAVTLGTFIL